MKRSLLALMTAFCFGLTGTAMTSLESVATAAVLGPVALPAGDIALGIYDPGRVFSRDNDVSIEHIFVYWQSLDLNDLRRRLDYAHERNRSMMVTIEPYTKAANWRDGGDHLFPDITSGEFDKQIEIVCSAMGKFAGPIMVRWGHEMEDPTGRYPWARKDYEGYKAAYRYFVKSCREYTPTAAFVWSPKGEKSLAKYYPGDEYVDYVGVAVWGLQAMDIDFFGHGRDFQTTFPEKYGRVSRFGKPVVIAELGVSGDKDYRDNWFSNMFKSIASRKDFALLRGVVYFNDKEPHHWPMGYGAPDWRIGSDWFSQASQIAGIGR